MQRYSIPTRDFRLALQRAMVSDDPEDKLYVEHLLNDFAFADDFVLTKLER